MANGLCEHQLGDIRLLGFSLAGEESVIAAPELNVCFDVGRAPRDIICIDHVLLTHGHMDHAAGLAYYFSQRNFIGTSPGTALVPAPLEAPIRDLLRVWGSIEGHVSQATVIGLRPGEEHELRRGLVARTFAVNHGVPALGFSVVDVRLKLRPEFADKTGPELVALKKQGVQIQYTLEVPLVTYCGDTAEGGFLDLDIVRKARVLILECTFFDDDHIRRARAGRHMHAKDVARILPRLDCEHVLISHVTRRTSLKQARATLAKMVDPEVMARVRFMMEGRRARPAAVPEIVKDREDRG